VQVAGGVRDLPDERTASYGAAGTLSIVVDFLEMKRTQRTEALPKRLFAPARLHLSAVETLSGSRSAHGNGVAVVECKQDAILFDFALTKLTVMT
jgi:hypothetical protein